MKINKFLSIAVISSGLVFGSCTNDLDTVPLDKTVATSEIVFDNPDSYKEFLAKLYGSLTLTGQRGPFGLPEITNPDEGETSFLRMYFTAQEITTDEVICAWGDAGLNEYRGHNWSAQNKYIQLLYQRIFINIAFCNEYIKEVSKRKDGLSGTLKDDVTQYLAEARFMRSLLYYFAIDLYGNVPFVTEENVAGAFLPEQISRADLFTYIETELKAIMPDLAAAGTNEYARADQGAASLLLAKLYLNAEVYLGAGNKKYTEAITYCNNIIGSGAYELHDKYNELFLADNHLRRKEIILPIAEDGINGQNYGGVTYIVHAGTGGTQNTLEQFGVVSPWNGNRVTQSFVNKFPDVTGDLDQRAMFYTDGQTLDIQNPLLFTEGYLNTKYKNITSTGTAGKDQTFVDTDFPLFRFADVYLIYAEAVLRGGSGGDLTTALKYVNLIRERAYGNTTGNITAEQLTLPFILDERARELNWEAQRRTDLIRFGAFTGNSYKWNWKGGIKEGVGTDAKNDVFPIPASDLAVNTNLEQNTGY
ncbi:MAG TPA: RagB/SusD family nutrient uptake outer membrane protein [Cytophagales bacterium]|nr:RagB/SusD family nutrient uptake outer membrane protein [Cytophagales bacterium]